MQCDDRGGTRTSDRSSRTLTSVPKGGGNGTSLVPSSRMNNARISDVFMDADKRWEDAGLYIVASSTCSLAAVPSESRTRIVTMKYLPARKRQQAGGHVPLSPARQLPPREAYNLHDTAVHKAAAPRPHRHTPVGLQSLAPVGFKKTANAKNATALPPVTPPAPRTVDFATQPRNDRR